MQSEVEHILNVQNELGEGPIWSQKEQMLYWVDIEQGNYYRFDPNTTQYEVVHVGTPIGVMAERSQGGLVMATKDGFLTWNPQTQERSLITNPEADKPSMRFNDGAVDSGGRFWAGSMNQDESAPASGTLYRLDPDGRTHAMITSVGTPNGIGWSPDNTTMYFTDSPLRTIFAFDFDTATGAISNRRVFVHTPEDSSVPDGLTVDSEGYVWSAHWGGARVVRYDPQGRVERTIAIPALQVTSCVFGGPNLDELYITSAWIGLSPQDRQRYPLSGDLFRIKTDVRGLPKYPFAG